MSIANRVIFRLPNSASIFTLDEGKGEDGFEIQSFEKPGNHITLKGSLRLLQISEAFELINSWQLPAFTELEEFAMPYTKLVTEAINAIKTGNFYKVVLARKATIKSSTRLFELFQNLEQSNPSAFVYAFCIDGIAMIGASPETLLRLENHQLYTEALGGTKTRGAYSEKELDEHHQIVDYISSILRSKSYVFQLKEMQKKSAGKVEHLQTPISIESKGMNIDMALLNQLHPTSAVCGLPYESSYQFIKKNEGLNRNYYSGYLGVIHGQNAFEMYVNLRCARVFEGVYELYAGAGINEMSDPNDELVETDNKLQTIAQWLK